MIIQPVNTVGKSQNSPTLRTKLCHYCHMLRSPLFPSTGNGQKSKMLTHLASMQPPSSATSSRPWKFICSGLRIVCAKSTDCHPRQSCSLSIRMARSTCIWPYHASMKSAMLHPTARLLMKSVTIFDTRASSSFGTSHDITPFIFLSHPCPSANSILNLTSLRHLHFSFLLSTLTQHFLLPVCLRTARLPA